MRLPRDVGGTALLAEILGRSEERWTPHAA